MIIIALVVLAALAWLAYTEYSDFLHAQPTTVVVALDITDSDLTLPTAEYVVELSGLATNPYGETFIEFVLVTDEEIAPIRQLHLDKVFALTVNDRERRKHVYDFEQEIAEILYDIEIMNRELQHSAIYTHINAALDRLNEVTGTKKLIIASNGYEHTEKFSVYKNKKLEDSRFVPEVYAESLKKIETPADITNVEIIFFLNPHGRVESVYQKQVVQAYHLLYPQANITIQTL